MAEWEAVTKKETKEENKVFFREKQEENREEVEEKANDGEMLVFRRALSKDK